MKHQTNFTIPNDDKECETTQSEPGSIVSAEFGTDAVRGESVKKFWVPRLNDKGKIELIQAYLF